MKVLPRFLLVNAILFLACSCQQKAFIDEPKETELSDGFQSDRIETVINDLENIEKKIIYLEDESDLLKIRSRWVDAQMSAARSRRGELQLAKEMAKYGRLNERLPGDSGFLNTGQRKNWNQTLHQKKKLSEQLFAIARLIERDLVDAESEFAQKHNSRELNASSVEVVLD